MLGIAGGIGFPVDTGTDRSINAFGLEGDTP